MLATTRSDMPMGRRVLFTDTAGFFMNAGAGAAERPPSLQYSHR
jgi:hypothetical protein